MIFGAIGGFTGGWMAWIQAVTIAPIEVEATLGYLNSQYPSLDMVKANGTLDGKGIALGAGFMLVFTVINIMGVRWLAESNSIATYWKIADPDDHDLRAAVHGRSTPRTSPRAAASSRYGFHGIFSALPLGIVFALEGFEQAIQVGGEAENPQRNIPRAVIGSMLIGTAIYILLEVAFVGALNPANLAARLGRPRSRASARSGRTRRWLRPPGWAGCPRC